MLYLALLFTACDFGAHTACARPPKGYAEVKVTDDPTTFEYFPRINNRGQIVFTSRNPGDGNDDLDEIFLYDNGNITQITDNRKGDRWPDINDEGTIVWSSEIGPEGEWDRTFEIMMRTPDGRIRRLTDDASDDYEPRINNLGHVAWYRDFGYGCALDAWRSEIFFFDGQSENRITFDAEGPDAFSNQLRDLNDLDEMVWTKYNFCVVGWWDSDIILYRDGRMKQLDPDYSFEPQVPTINNDGLVVWMNNFNEDGRWGLQAWENGVVSDLTQWGSVPVVNASGEIAFHRGYGGGRAEIWTYTNGGFRQMTSDGGLNMVPTINDRGDIAFDSGDAFVTDIRLLVNGGGVHRYGSPRQIPSR
ncbi:MAG: hypothetical protein IT449_18155 [Phycisphaerales bacterium]|nr:hypothetical protein [Phycisphaerales bacterium]